MPSRQPQKHTPLPEVRTENPRRCKRLWPVAFHVRCTRYDSVSQVVAELKWATQDVGCVQGYLAHKKGGLTMFCWVGVAIVKGTIGSSSAFHRRVSWCTPWSMPPCAFRLTGLSVPAGQRSDNALLQMRKKTHRPHSMDVFTR